MSFIRPEAQETIWRWREVLVGIGLLIFGVYLAMVGLGVQAWAGVTALVVGVTLIVAGWQRGRFRSGSKGAGVVHVTERQITYYGPYNGGVAALEQIDSIVLDPTAKPSAQWRLERYGEDPLTIPIDSEGAEALFDAFSALPGLKTEEMLGHLAHPGDTTVLIWQRRRVALH